MTAAIPAGGRYIGARVHRVEDDRFLRGLGTYVDDIELHGLLHVAFVRSPHAHARIVSTDLAAARALPGVVAVYVGPDLQPYLGPVVSAAGHPESHETRQQPLPTDRVRHVGEAVVAVVARSRYIAEDACQLVEIDYEPLPAVMDGEAAMLEDAPVLEEGLPANNVAHIVWDGGDVDAAFADAAHVFKKRFTMSRSAAMPLETRGIVAQHDRGTGELTIWMSTQFPHVTRAILAGALGIPQRRVRIIAPAVGGGFGVKVAVYPEDVVLPAIALALGRPVKWIEDRYEHLAASSHSKELTADMELAVDEDGTFLGIKAHFIGNGGGYSSFPFTTLVDPLCAAGMIFNQYAIPAGRSVVDGPLTNKCPTAACRGVGWTPGHTAREVFIDDVARALDADPVELRLKNTIPSAPYRTPFGQQYDGGSYSESLERASALLEYGTFRERQRRLREEGRYVGIGFSPYVEPAGWSNKVDRANRFSSKYFDSASVTVDPDGSVTVTTGLCSQGQGHETSFAQVAADRLGVRIEDVRVVQGDTARAAFGMGVYASRGATIATGTITRAAEDVRAKLLQLASQHLEASAEDLELAHGVAAVRGAPGVSVTVAELAAGVYWGGVGEVDGADDVALTATRSYDPGETYSNGCVAAVVEVDVETGVVDVQRIVHVEDCGTMLNPTIVEGQMAGAIAMGFGMAMLEEVVYDDDGQLLTASLMDYLYPTAAELPAFELDHIETPSPVTEGGVKGMGEAGSIGAPAALINAVADALSPFGVSIDRTPLHPDRVLSLIRDARSPDAEVVT